MANDKQTLSQNGKPLAQTFQQQGNEEASCIYKVTREQIDSQYNISNQRIFWLILSQSFFFNAFVMLVNGKPSPEHARLFSSLMWVIPAASIATILFTYIDVIAFIRQINKLIVNYKQHGPDDEAKGFPSINGDTRDRIFSRISPYCLPVMFILMWVALLINM